MAAASLKLVEDAFLRIAACCPEVGGGIPSLSLSRVETESIACAKVWVG